MRCNAITVIALLNLGASAAAHPQSGVEWVLPDYDGKSFLSCEKTSEKPECRRLLHPCETAFNVAVGGDLSALPPKIRHDLTACFMAQFRSYEDALWRLASGSDPDPTLSRNNSMMFVHHGNAPGTCRSTQTEKTEDWRCAADEILVRLLDAEKTAR